MVGIKSIMEFMTVTRLKNRFVSFIYSGFILLILSTSHTFAQSNIRLSGWVTDMSSGFPLSNVAVQVENTTHGTYTDEDGFFFIENIPRGNYSIRFSCLGYEIQEVSNIEVVADVAKRLVVNLKPEPIQADSIIVVGEPVNDESGIEGKKIVITGKDLEHYRQLGISNLLQQVAGVQIESQSSGGNRSIVRIHGGRSSQVLVLLDGQRLNNPQTGEVDLNEIPLEQVERIEVIRQGNSSMYGSNAFDGIVEFHTRQVPQTQYFSLNSQTGSFSTITGSFSSGLNICGIGGLFNYQQDYSYQDFSYQYDGSTFTRDNSWYRNRKAFSKIGYEINRYQLKLLYNYNEGNRGLPCSFFNECGDLSSKMNEKSEALQANQRWIFSSESYLEGMISYYRLYQFYDNVEDPIRINRYRTEQTNENLEADLTGNFSAGSFSEIRLGVHYLNEMMDQQNLLYPQLSIGQKSRRSRAAFGGVEMQIPGLNPIWEKASIHTSLRYEKCFSHQGRWYPAMGLNIVPAFWNSLIISGGWYKAVRYPDFNSLFWKGDTRAQGNPGLLPEQKTAWTAAVRIRQNQEYFPEVGVHYYSENITNLIFWHRSFDGVWEPRNEDKAEKQGIDAELHQNIIANHVQFQTAYSWVDAINKDDEPNRYDRQIIFVPEHTINSSLWIGWGDWQSQIVHRKVSERETVPANSNGTQLNGYEVWDISTSYKHRLGKISGTVGLAVKNLTDTDYQLLYGYPMPGREFQLSISMNFETQPEAQ